MIKEYLYIDLLFENCNYVKLHPEDVLYLGIGEITKDIWINMSGQLTEVLRCKAFDIIFRSSAINNKTHFNKDHEFQENNTFKNHIDNYKDITRVIIKVNENLEYDISIPYKEENEKELGSPNTLLHVDYNCDVYRSNCIRVWTE